jgi:hypothetical protein
MSTFGLPGSLGHMPRGGIRDHFQIALAQEARVAFAVLMASVTSALPKVRHPYSDWSRLRLSRSKR